MGRVVIYANYAVAAFFPGIAALGVLTAYAELGADFLRVVPVVGIVAANLVFFFLTGAPTPLGRRRMDEIAGLRLYLTVAEAERMNMGEAPRMSPAHFETLLPYAVALGVEQPWSRAFDAWLRTSGEDVGGFRWYRGIATGGSVGASLGSAVGSLAGSLTSWLPVSSGSGVSGGSSGAGRGGGGGRGLVKARRRAKAVSVCAAML